MPRYISQHTIACMTRQALQARDKETVLAFLTVHNMHPQWVMRVENEW
jgi:hypothetical protein